MKEIRKDAITGDLVIYSSYRNKRPLDKVKTINDFDTKDHTYSETCPFCRGNEKENDDLKEIIERDGQWVAKSVGNKFPILDMSTEEIFGEHEVIIESYRHNGSYYNMSLEEFNDAFRLFRSRFTDLSKVKGIEYVGIFKNSKRNAGASLMHPHSQIVSFNMIPPEIEKEICVANSYRKENGANLYEDIIKGEQEYKKRIIHEGNLFMAFVPYATRYNGEVRIIAKTDDRIDQWDSSHIEELSYIFKNLFANMEEYQGDIPFNVLVHTRPINDGYGDELRTHFHIVPRKYNFGGFELCTNFFVCGSDPDELAEAFRF